MTDCAYCDDRGYFEDPVLKETQICPMCRPIDAELEAIRRIYGSMYRKDLWPCMPAKYIGPRFCIPPWLIVLHSGKAGEGVAEYFEAPGDKRRVSAHIAWSKLHNKFAQCVPLDCVAWHAGGGEWRGNRRLNFCSIGIEMPGPVDRERSIAENTLTVSAISNLITIWPSLKEAVPHWLVDPSRPDPGNFDWHLLDGIIDYPKEAIR